MSVSVWGFRPEEDGQPMWVAVTIDFQSLITRQCKSTCYNSVYHYIYPVHSLNVWKPTTGCLRGQLLTDLSSPYLTGNDQDYEEWLAHSTQGVGERNGCVLGVKEIYKRLKKQSLCRNGRNFVVSKKQSPCLCTREDYLW